MCLKGRALRMLDRAIQAENIQIADGKVFRKQLETERKPACVTWHTRLYEYKAAIEGVPDRPSSSRPAAK